MQSSNQFEWSGATVTVLWIPIWGNVTNRINNATTATLSYDVLDHLVAWDAGSTNQEWYAYDASGNRVLRRSTTTSGTSITTYAFGLEEHLYGATGINTGNTYYYTLGGRLIGALTGITTLTPQFFLTDALGSVLATFSATAGSAAVLGNQVYGPYGNQRYTQGSMGTAKGYTGQYADATGLDYYNARYYDPIVGRFVSADTVQGNEQGMDPYAYVMANPETMNDPTGHWGWGLAATLLPIVAVAVGAVALGALMAGAAPLLATIALGAAVGVVSAGVISYMSYSDANGSPFSTDQSLDDWGKRALLAEGIGGVVGGVASWVGMATAPWLAATFNAPNSEALANGIGLITGGAGGIVGQGVSQTVFPSHPKQQSQSKPTPTRSPSPVVHSNPKIVLGPRKASAPKQRYTPTYTHKTTRSSSTWTQTATSASYSYTATVYHNANPLYNYSVFSASNGYYQRSRGGTSVS